MEPAFVELDRVLTYNWGPIVKGSVIVFREPSRHPEAQAEGSNSSLNRFFALLRMTNNTYFIKRVKVLYNDHVVAVSDNKKLAKKEYMVKMADVIGRVFLKY